MESGADRISTVGLAPSIKLMSDTMRHIAFEACFNFRDLGGYESRDGRHTRWGRLFRSDTLHRLTAADAEMFHDLGLRTVIDLRSFQAYDLPPAQTPGSPSTHQEHHKPSIVAGE